MENAHRKEDTGSESNDLHKVCSEDEDPCEEGVNGIYESEQCVEISPSQEEDFVFSEVNEDVQDITQDQGLNRLLAIMSYVPSYYLFIRSISVSISFSLNSGVDCTEGEVVITVLIGSGSVPGVRILDSCIFSAVS